MNTDDTLFERAAAIGELAYHGAVNQGSRTKRSLADHLALYPNPHGGTWPNLCYVGLTFSDVFQPAVIGITDPDGRKVPQSSPVPNYHLTPAAGGYAQGADIAEIPDRLFASLSLAYEHGLFARGAVLDGDLAAAVYFTLLGRRGPAASSVSRVSLWLPPEMAGFFDCFAWQHVEAGWAPLTLLANSLGIPGPAGEQEDRPRKRLASASSPWIPVGRDFAFAGPLLDNHTPAWFESSLSVPVWRNRQVFMVRVPPPEVVLSGEVLQTVRTLVDHPLVAPVQEAFSILRAAERVVCRGTLQGLRSNQHKHLREGREQAKKLMRAHLRLIERARRDRWQAEYRARQQERRLARELARAEAAGIPRPTVPTGVPSWTPSPVPGGEDKGPLPDSPAAAAAPTSASVWNMWHTAPPASLAAPLPEPDAEEPGADAPPAADEGEVQLPSGAWVRTRRNRLR
jgi:hypothetical protein